MRYVLEGSVRKSDHRLRITAQLIDGKSGNQIWAGRYDRDYSAPFDLQDEITRDVVASLECVLWIALVRELGHPDPETSPLRAAGYHLTEFTHLGHRTAIECAKRALEANPKSVAAYQYLANAYIDELFAGWSENPAADIENLLEAGRMATALSPADHLSEGLYGLALVQAGHHDDGLARARRALVLNNNSVHVLGPCANVLTFCGDATGANDLLERTLRLAPAHYLRSVFLSGIALNWFQRAQPQRGLAFVGESLKLKPEAICNHLTHARLLAAVGQDKAADMAVCDGLRLRPDIDHTLIRAMFPYRDQSISEWLTSAVRRLANA